MADQHPPCNGPSKCHVGVGLLKAARADGREARPVSGDTAGRRPERRTHPYARGQNFIIACSDADQGSVLSGTNQPDPYVVLHPNPGGRRSDAPPEEEITLDRVGGDGGALMYR